MPRALGILLLACLLACCSGGSREHGSDGTEDRDAAVAETLIDGTKITSGDAEASGEEEPMTATPFTFAVISDTHLALPPSHPNSVIFAETGLALAGLDPPVAFVVVTGDVVDDLFTLPELVLSGEPIPILEATRERIEAHYPMPFYLVLGNHDNRVIDTFVPAVAEAAEERWVETFEGSESFPAPYYAVDHGGFRFLFLNGTDDAYDHDSNDKASFSEAQLVWLDEQLSDGLPSVLFWHQHVWPPPLPSMPAHPILERIRQHVEANAPIKAVFMGHGHHFKRADWQGVTLYETEGLKWHDAPVYHLVSADPATGELTILEPDPSAYGGAPYAGWEIYAPASCTMSEAAELQGFDGACEPSSSASALEHGVPSGKPFLITTDVFQHMGIAMLDERCQDELDQPCWRAHAALTETDTCLLPTLLSLHRDPGDLRDP